MSIKFVHIYNVTFYTFSWGDLEYVVNMINYSKYYITLSCLKKIVQKQLILFILLIYTITCYCKWIFLYVFKMSKCFIVFINYMFNTAADFATTLYMHT